MSSDVDEVGETVPGEQLGERPAGDALVRQVARARVANALFATDERVQIGRYRLLERVGAGGMGVVWGAWDPELARRVALKLVHAQSEHARDRMLAEGQALAKLSHPNVVPIYDVGVIDDQLYLVMEWIRGENLRAYAKEGRTVRELVAAYRAAGEGLYAAHRAGIVHRDFKPDNVMVGEDGRVRVLDFGLARDEATTGDAQVAGTPRYMAPEQSRGDALTGAADQYAFCVSLRESLTASGQALPGWIATIITRGTAADAAERFPSMAELLAALGRDPRTLWRRRLLAAGAVAAAGIAFTVGTLRASGPDPCDGSGTELARVWNDAARARLLAHGHELGSYGSAEAATLADRFTAYGTRWAVARRDACLAHHRSELTEPLFERGLACFARSRAALETVIEVSSRAPVQRFPDAVLAARDLPDVDHCVSDATASTVEPPDHAHAQVVSALEADASRASYLALAADPTALSVAEPVARAAETVRYRPLVARAQLALGAALATDPKRRSTAVAAYARAAAAALGVFDDVTFVEAFARELFVAAGNHQPELAALVATLPFVETVAERTGTAGQFARALLFNNVGTARLAAGDVKGAESWFRKANAEPQPEGRGIELWAILGNLAMTVGNRDERDRLFAEERTRLERTLGPHHAFTLMARLRAAQFVENRQVAAAQLGEICAAFERWYPHGAETIGKCNYELGWLAIERGDAAAARAAFGRVVEPERAERARLYLELLGDDAAKADRDATAFAQRTAALQTWWERFPAVDAWLVAAAAREAAGNRAAAIAALRSALVVLADPASNQTATFYQRRLARARARLAILAHDDTAAAQAIAWYRSAGGYDAAIAELVTGCPGCR